jgi:long-chain acyl-CoA synthetase
MFKGPGLASGYWKKPKETRDTFVSNGWLRSGDACWMDEEGFIYFSDRYKDLIVASGYNIAPLEVESVLMGHLAVKEAAVIGVPDEYRGETVKAFISLTEKAKAIEDNEGLKQDILRHCKNELATFKVPKDIEIIDEIPKNAVGKILRRQLREKK